MIHYVRWFGLIGIVMVLHMIEQLLFGLQELDRIRIVLASWNRLFTNSDTAIVVLVTIAASLVYLAIYCILLGGNARFYALFGINIVALAECHHMIESLIARAYTPGLVTSFPIVGLGILFLRDLLRERRAQRSFTTANGTDQVLSSVS